MENKDFKSAFSLFASMKKYQIKPNMVSELVWFALKMSSINFLTSYLNNICIHIFLCQNDIFNGLSVIWFLGAYMSLGSAL